MEPPALSAVRAHPSPTTAIGGARAGLEAEGRSDAGAWEGAAPALTEGGPVRDPWRDPWPSDVRALACALLVLVVGRPPLPTAALALASVVVLLALLRLRWWARRRRHEREIGLSDQHR